MKIVDPFYLITTFIILVGLPLLTYIKFSQEPPKVVQIAIYGSGLQPALLAYAIDKQLAELKAIANGRLRVNVTLVNHRQQPYEPNISYPQIGKTLHTFCSIEKESIAMLQAANLKYHIKQYGVYFTKLQGKTSLQISSLGAQDSLKSVMNYGLSHYAAKMHLQNMIDRLYKNKSNTANTPLGDLSIYSLLLDISEGQLHQSGMKELVEHIGLDYTYLSDFILPIIRANYMRQADLISTSFKLLPLYCKDISGYGGKSLALLQYPEILRNKLLQSLKSVQLNQIENYRLISFLSGDHKSKLTLSNNDSLFTVQDKGGEMLQLNQNIDNSSSLLSLDYNLLFIFSNSQESNAIKQITYYKTIVDGIMKSEASFEDLFTLYMRNPVSLEGRIDLNQEKLIKHHKNSTVNPIFSITRICSQNCKNYQNNVYVVLSKLKISEKDLTMFSLHSIVLIKKCNMRALQSPLKNKLQESKNVLRMYDVDTVTDSLQVKLSLMRKIAKAVARKVKSAV